MTKTSETWSVRLPAELKNRIKEQEWPSEYVAGLLQQALDGERASALVLPSQSSKELSTLGKQLQGVLDRAYSLHTLATQNEVAAEEKVFEVQAMLTTIKAEAADRKEADAQVINELREQIGQLQQEKAELAEKVEDIAGLRAGWDQQRQDLTARIGELDAEAKETRNLKSQLAQNQQEIRDLKTELANQAHAHELALKDAELAKKDAVAVALSKAREETEEQLGMIQAEHDHLMDTAKAEADGALKKVESRANVAESKAEAATAEFATVQSELVRAKVEVEAGAKALEKAEKALSKAESRAESAEAKIADLTEAVLQKQSKRK